MRLGRSGGWWRKKESMGWDTVVANAGISELYPVVSQVKTADLQRHITTNVLPLLRKSPVAKWVTMGSSAGGLKVSFLPLR